MRLDRHRRQAAPGPLPGIRHIFGPLTRQDHETRLEDDPIIALGLEDTIFGFGVAAVRTAASVARALEMIAERAPDFALLDVGLVREKSFAIAERLEALKIPFVFVTGYGAADTFPARFANKPKLNKPCSTDAVKAILKRWSDGAAEG